MFRRKNTGLKVLAGITTAITGLGIAGVFIPDTREKIADWLAPSSSIIKQKDEEIKVSQETIEDYKVQINNLKTEVATKTAIIDKINKRIEILTTEKEDIALELSELKIAKAEDEQTILDKQARITEIEAELTTLQNLHENCDTQIETLTNEKETLQNDIETLQSSIQSKDFVIEEKILRINELQNQVNDLQTTNSNLQTQVTELQAQVQDLQDRLENDYNANLKMITEDYVYVIHSGSFQCDLALNQHYYGSDVNRFINEDFASSFKNHRKRYRVTNNNIDFYSDVSEYVWCNLGYSIDGEYHYFDSDVTFIYKDFNGNIIDDLTTYIDYFGFNVVLKEIKETSFTEQELLDLGISTGLLENAMSKLRHFEFVFQVNCLPEQEVYVGTNNMVSRGVSKCKFIVPEDGNYNIVFSDYRNFDIKLDTGNYITSNDYTTDFKAGDELIFYYSGSIEEEQSVDIIITKNS